MPRLLLDGVYDLKQTLEIYGVHQNKPNTLSNFFWDSLWLRATIPVHTALTCVRTITTQSLRCISNLAGGIILLDKNRLLMGFNDLLSTIIQAIALPILGIISFVAPSIGQRLMNTLCKKLDVTGAEERPGGEVLAPFEVPTNNRSLKNRVADGVVAVFGTLSAFVQVFTFSLERLCDLKFSGRPLTMWEAIRDTGETMVFAGRAISNEHHVKTAYKAHRIAIE